MGTKRRVANTGLADALFSPVQQRVLGLLFGQPGRRFQSSEIIRLAGSGTGGVHRLLTRLAGAELITVTRQGNQKHYQANRNSPVFAELHGLVVKTSAVVEPLKRALASKAKGIKAAFVYGSLAKGSATSSSDVDLLVISDTLRYPDIIEAIQPAELALARTINPTVLNSHEWRAKRAAAGSFASRIAKAPRLFVIGSADDLD
jgi:predicted nucleotidyltransferase